MKKSRYARCAAMIAMLAAAAMTTGCAFLNNAGSAVYQVTRSASGCDLTVTDGKEFAGRDIVFNGGDCTLTLKEGQSKAFAGQALVVKAINIMPTIGLADILAPRDR